MKVYKGKRRVSLWAISIVFLGFFTAFTRPAGEMGKARDIRISFYNVENLFDTIDDVDVLDEEFTPQGDNQWNSERYYRKLDHLARVISSMHEGQGPQILGVCEVENRRVLEDLAAHPLLKKLRLKVYHEDSPDKRGIDVAFLVSSKLKVAETRKDLVNLPDTGEFTRPVYWVKVKTGREYTWLAACHFPSRRGGQDESEPRRILAAGVVKNTSDSLLKADKNARIIIMGDFNDEPHDISLFKTLNAGYDSAQQTLVNLMLPLKDAGQGSYKYRDQWNMLDQFIVSRALLQKEEKPYYKAASVAIFSPDWMKETEGKYAGSPLRTYAGKKYLGGYSDHFPIQLQLVN